MAEYLSPGIYVEEYDNSSRSMEGVGTSTAGFIGMAAKGQVEGAPQLITSYSEFLRVYGEPLTEFAYGDYRFLASSVEQFFVNGGTKCYVARVAAPGAELAKIDSEVLPISAKNAGAWGNRIKVNFSSVEKIKMQLLSKVDDNTYIAKSTSGFMEGDLIKFGAEINKIVTIFENQIILENAFEADVVDTALVPKKVVYLLETDMQIIYGNEVEVFAGLSFNYRSPAFVGVKLQESNIIDASIASFESVENPVSCILGEGKESGIITLSGGSDGSIQEVSAETFIGLDYGPGKRTGIQTFVENTEISMIAVPGITMPDVIVSLVAHCENLGNRFAVLDMPKSARKTNELIDYREMIDSTYAAMYHPWIQTLDRTTKKTGVFPPSGAVMGVYSRTDVARGVHKAPANETLMCSGLDVNYTKEEQDVLNPAGVNLIRSIPGNGIKIWGARTASSDSSFKYVNVRRLFIFVEESIRKNTNWVVFEPNDETLWSRVNITISTFLETLWRSGMLAGSSAAESFFVEIGPSTMTADDIRNGRLICNIGFAPVRPAEFVIFRVTQHTSESSGQ